MKTKIETNHCLSTDEMVIEFLKQQNYIPTKAEVEITTSCGVYNYRLVGNKWKKINPSK